MHTVVGAHDLVIVLRSGQFRQRVVKPRLLVVWLQPARSGRSRTTGSGRLTGSLRVS